MGAAGIMRVTKLWEEWAVKQEKTLYPAALGLGLILMCLRGLLYRLHVDGTGLLEPGTPLEWGVYLLTAAALAIFALAARKQGETVCAPKIAALGQILGALGLGITAACFSGEMGGALGTLWRVLGIAAAACLLWAAVCTMQRRNAGFFPQLVPCLFWVVHLLDNYRGWSGHPQLQSYVFPMLASMAATLLSYYTAAQTVGLGKPRTKKFCALAGGCLCLAAVLPGSAKTEILYFTTGLWALSCLYAPENSRKTG